MTIEPGRYTTRLGETAVILATDAPGELPIVGYIIRDKSEWASAQCWHATGKIFSTIEDDDDLMEKQE